MLSWMLGQLEKLNSNYPGGLAAYLSSARTLLTQSVKGENPLSGWSPSVPDDGFDLALGTDAFKAFEERGAVLRWMVEGTLDGGW